MNNLTNKQYHMKRISLLGIFVGILLLTACSDKPVTADQLPESVTSFIQQYFPGQDITLAKKDIELTGSQYDVVLADGTQIDFDSSNGWDKIECTLENPVPTALIPAPIVSQIRDKFPDAMILKIDRENDGYEVELANGLELKFNKQGSLMGMDD